MQMNDRELLARTLQAEAGNQGLPGMIAAGSVVMNRIGSGGYGGNLRDVILKPGQFSAWNSLTGYAGGEQGQDMTSMTPSAEAYKAADTLLAGGYEDPTGGATHYYNPAISQPSWGASAGGSWTEIGDHLFGQADAGRNPNQGVAADAMRAIGRQPRGILEPTQTAETETAPMMQEEQPRGLLEGLGIQRMEEGAEGETGQRFFQRDSFKDTAATLAQGFAALGSNPAVQKFAADVAGQRTEAKAKNKTIDYLRRSGRDDLADAVESGSLGARDAAGILFKQPKAQAGIAVGGRIVNPVTGQVIYEDTSKPAFDAEAVQKARKEFTSLPPVKAFSDQTTAYGRVIASVEDPSPSGDLALIFNYMKVLDPGSVVREGEFATAQNAGSVDDRTRGLYNRIVNGERLSDAQRADFADRATRLYQNAEQQYSSIAQQYGSFAEAAGLPVDQVIPDFSYSGDMYQKPLSLRPPAPPSGVTPEQWSTAWQNMTDDERSKFMEGVR